MSRDDVSGGSPSRHKALWLLPERLAICEVNEGAIPDLPYDCDDEPVVIVSHGNGHTILCPEEYLPSGTPMNRGWRAYRVDGTAEECQELLDILDALDPHAVCFATLQSKFLVVHEHIVGEATAQLVADGIPVFEI